MAALPKYVAFRSKFNNKYLEVEDGGGEFHGFIRFSGGLIVTAFTKFEVELADSNPNLVHIRSVHNNKYWVATEQSAPWIAAAADKPEEDRSKWNCTMFEPRSILPGGGGTDFRFLHVHQGRFARLMTMANRFEMVLPLVTNPDLIQSLDVITVINWESLVIMPQYVCFKGANDLFLRGSVVRNLNHLQFETPDGRDPPAAHEVHLTPNGSLRIRSLHFNRFWRRGTGNWILADSTDTTNNNIDTLFWPFQIGDNVIALRNMGNNMFCNMLTHDWREDCLNAGIGAMSTATELEVSELVVSRSIFNTVFHLMDARIYNEQVIVMGTGSASNTTDSEASLEVKITLTDSTSNHWSTSVSLMLGLKATVVTKIPFIFEGKVETSAELTTTYEMGRTITKETSFETTYIIVVPPRTRATVRALATRSTCDVPFSYTQTDLNWNGERPTKRLEDGIYTGINSYGVHYEPLLTPLDRTALYDASVLDPEMLVTPLDSTISYDGSVLEPLTVAE